MHIACLCPTYGRPSLVRNSMGLFLAQELRLGDTAHLIIFDDANQIAEQKGAVGPLSWSVHSSEVWIPLPVKYHSMVQLAGEADVYACWDDDDVYLTWHLDAIAAVCPDDGWAHPRYVLSTYGTNPLTEPPIRESAAGRFHGALAVGAGLLDHVGGWPDTLQATYDQQMIARLHQVAGPPNDPCAVHAPSYIYRWGDTGRHHASGSIDERGEYHRPPIQEPGRVEVLTPEYDTSTRALLARFSA